MIFFYRYHQPKASDYFYFPMSKINKQIHWKSTMLNQVLTFTKHSQVIFFSSGVIKGRALCIVGKDSTPPA